MKEQGLLKRGLEIQGTFEIQTDPIKTVASGEEMEGPNVRRTSSDLQLT